MSKFYEGTSNPKDCEYIVLVRETTSLKTEELNPRLDLRNHSPTGLSWGYAGSGPAQCALAILADYFNDVIAQEHYQDFKREVVAMLPNTWELTGEQLEEWLSRQENKR